MCGMWVALHARTSHVSYVHVMHMCPTVFECIHPCRPVDVTTERKVQVVQPGLFHDYGGKTRFSGKVTTIKCFENNPLVRKVGARRASQARSPRSSALRTPS